MNILLICVISLGLVQEPPPRDAAGAEPPATSEDPPQPAETPRQPPPIFEPRLGPWRGWLASPGGELPFQFEIESKKISLKATIFNGAEMVRVTSVAHAPPNRMLFAMHHYDAVLVGDLNEARDEMTGFWKKRTRGDNWATLPFSARAGETHRFSPPGDRPGMKSEGAKVSGRWAVQFASETHPSVALFQSDHEGNVTGTILNAGGDLRYLDGDFIDNRLRLSTFDGAIAMLLHATLQPDGTLAGDFWSGDSWHDTWKAARDDMAQLSDSASITRLVSDPELGSLIFFDLNKQRRALDETEFQGRARIIEIMGTWCPNCHDSAALLMELYRKYRDRGLNVMAIAYEHSADLNRNLRQIKNFAGRLGIEYTVLYGGSSDIAAASRTLPFLDRVHAFPTTLFLDHEGQVRLIDTGFVGPAAGAEHEKLRQRYEGIIEELLATAPPAEPVDAP